ncbi:hypothetical protein scyTo_0002385 [Scyliorhinus torazame]|uniref:Uncharacterized protein n=1 Tax=Scyliorhinus torazame TaxID=75743 RepID=A0A401PJ84_SCYTO|nr:hypothetical protein [Scyliorhinus torazame]
MEPFMCIFTSFQERKETFQEMMMSMSRCYLYQEVIRKSSHFCVVHALVKCYSVQLHHLICITELALKLGLLVIAVCNIK